MSSSSSRSRQTRHPRDRSSRSRSPQSRHRSSSRKREEIDSNTLVRQFIAANQSFITPISELKRLARQVAHPRVQQWLTIHPEWKPQIRPLLESRMEMVEHFPEIDIDFLRLYMQAGADINYDEDDLSVPPFLYLVHKFFTPTELYAPHPSSNKPSDSMERPISHIDLNMITSLLDSGANPNLRTSEHNELLQHPVDPNVRVRGAWTALEAAVIHQHEPLVHALLTHGGDPNILFRDGASPLQIAILNRNMNIVRDLLAHGARAGRAELEQAVGTRSVPLIKLMLQHGAPRDRIMEFARTHTPDFADRLIELIETFEDRLFKRFELFTAGTRTDKILKDRDATRRIIDLMSFGKSKRRSKESKKKKSIKKENSKKKKC